jgi:hypothetical protein
MGIALGYKTAIFRYFFFQGFDLISQFQLWGVWGDKFGG